MFICPIWFKSSKLHKFHIYALKMWFWCQMQNKKGSLHLCSCNLLSHRHACLQSELHQEPRLPSMAVRRKTPLLHFYSPILDSVPEKARNVRAAQFKPGTCRKSLSILLHSSLFFIISVFSGEMLREHLWAHYKQETQMGKKHRKEESTLTDTLTLYGYHDIKASSAQSIVLAVTLCAP